MICATDLTKRFDKFAALDRLTLSVPDGVVYGLVGSNGAGKSTFLRLVAGIYCSDAGTLTLGGQDASAFPIYENPQAKAQIVLVPDELYFLAQASLNRMAGLYRRSFPTFDDAHFQRLVALFDLDPKKPLNAFSKGMRRQAAILLAFACRPRYLLLDEAFDGLDPLKRDLVRKIIARDVAERGTTVIISSHSLRELEGTCDWLALLHNGQLIFESAKADLLVQAPQGLEQLFVDRLKEVGYSFDAALDAAYAGPPVAGTPYAGEPVQPSATPAAVDPVPPGATPEAAEAVQPGATPEAAEAVQPGATPATESEVHES